MRREAVPSPRKWGPPFSIAGPTAGLNQVVVTGAEVQTRGTSHPPNERPK